MREWKEPPASAARRLLWFVVLWSAGVSAVAATAILIRALLASAA